MQTIIAQNRLANATKLVKDGSQEPKATFLSNPAEMERMEQAARWARALWVCRVRWAAVQLLLLGMLSRCAAPAGTTTRAAGLARMTEGGRTAWPERADSRTGSVLGGEGRGH